MNLPRRTSPRAQAVSTAATKPTVRYRVEVLSPQAHLFAITLEIDHPAPRQRLSLPVWIPGSYLVREFSQHLQHLQATQGGEPVPLRQLDKNSWQVMADAGHPLVLHYEVYAFDASVRTAFLDSTRGFFNATSLCLRVNGQEDQAQGLEVVPGQAPADWRVATGLASTDVDGAGFGHYTAQDYDELADCPVELGSFWSGEFVAHGVPHRFVVSGAGGWFDGARLLADTRRICEAQIGFWHGTGGEAPFKSYLFMMHASGEGYGGLEHRNSTALICQRTDLPKLLVKDEKPPALKATDGYTTLLGLISHEYFHTWNVKRLRPAEFKRYDYDQENYTELLWFFEGFTSYYDDLILRRAGLIDDATYLQLVMKTFNQVQQTPGQQVQTAAQASFDAWMKYYRIHENTPNATVSYYTKGALVAMCFDLTLRAEGHSTLDAVMRELWAQTSGGPMKEADFARALKRLGGRAFDRELRDWVHGTSDLPVLPLLQQHGAKVHHDKAPLAQQLGLRVSESHGLVLKNVLRGGAAEAAGMAAGDEWLGVEFAPPRRGQPAEAWRIHKLDEVAQLRGQRQKLTALVSRDKRLLRCPLEWPTPTQAVRLTVGDASLLKPWLASAA
ncbi:M61 family metallopeptidase [Hydrogenophaga sp. D2P1]|uniref:M61 family metallopeptidase n=1 Tax=Hydrogenophaga aromaticivorans TaxID=2610898 RepID=A0A7Y8KV69_9BURK|nr:M61 family metallopeptidase [Hydrogenophaga aromaticivorans]NWF43694.1 M61 family metallopeptidase [Hydrogenophaga aromaticivorans]